MEPHDKAGQLDLGLALYLLTDIIGGHAAGINITYRMLNMMLIISYQVMPLILILNYLFGVYLSRTNAFGLVLLSKLR
jgi:hypothetical protein